MEFQEFSKNNLDILVVPVFHYLPFHYHFLTCQLRSVLFKWKTGIMINRKINNNAILSKVGWSL